MKKQAHHFASILILSGILYGGGHLYSQPRDHKPPMLPDSTHIVHRVDEMAKALSLSDQQKAGILKLHFEHFKMMKQMMENEKERHESVKAKHDQMRDQFENKILGLLTDAQKAEFESFNKTHQPPRPEGHPQDNNPGQAKRGLKMPKKGADNENQN